MKLDYVVYAELFNGSRVVGQTAIARCAFLHHAEAVRDQFIADGVKGNVWLRLPTLSPKDETL